MVWRFGLILYLTCSTCRRYRERLMLSQLWPQTLCSNAQGLHTAGFPEQLNALTRKTWALQRKVRNTPQFAAQVCAAARRQFSFIRMLKKKLSAAAQQQLDGPQAAAEGYYPALILTCAM